MRSEIDATRTQKAESEKQGPRVFVGDQVHDQIEAVRVDIDQERFGIL